ncbi:hypothetical protein SAMN04487995_2795 [Dyadobacter koreensis]|uniref:Dolichyl-phosphate-mannose-protein mannosyltransferase n=1 Tax=Dyadobacter koreensis TaxID=408657 RepID=A0A1H6V1J2_9BACT|nr:hypothetical protein SAMN04487995_2795 [Dyadobacter koreensis]
MVNHLYFKLFLYLFVVVLSAGLYFFCTYTAKNRLGAFGADIYLPILLTFTFLLRLPYILNIEVNVDTSTWISSLISIEHYPDRLWTFFNYTDSRPLTVFPLILISGLGVEVNYYTSECLGIIFWLSTVFFLFKTLNLYLFKSFSLVISWGLCLFIGTMFLSDYTSYNSEQLGILLLTASTYGYLRYLNHKTKQDFSITFSGLILGSLPYVKFQNVPMGLLIAVMLIIEIIQRREWKRFWQLIGGGLLPTLSINIYYLSENKLMVFWNNYFWNYFYYSYTTQFSNVPISERFNPVRIINFIYYSANSRIYMFSVTFVIFTALISCRNTIRTWDNMQKKTIIFSVLFTLISLYSILQSGNSFQHYRLYLLVPITLLLGLLIAFAAQQYRKNLALAFLVCCTVMAGFNLYTRPEKTDTSFENLDFAVLRLIEKESKANEPIVVWGWRDQLYVRSKRAMGFRDAHTFHFSLKSKLIPFWTKDFLQDMETNKPVLFIDTTKPADYSIFSRMLLPYERVPVINTYIKKHYTLLATIEGLRIFKRTR